MYGQQLEAGDLILEAVKDLIEGCLSANPLLRPNAYELLQHELF